MTVNELFLKISFLTSPPDIVTHSTVVYDPRHIALSTAAPTTPPNNLNTKETSDIQEMNLLSV